MERTIKQILKRCYAFQCAVCLFCFFFFRPKAIQQCHEILWRFRIPKANIARTVYTRSNDCQVFPFIFAFMYSKVKLYKSIGLTISLEYPNIFSTGMEIRSPAEHSRHANGCTAFTL